MIEYRQGPEYFREPRHNQTPESPGNEYPLRSPFDILRRIGGMVYAEVSHLSCNYLNADRVPFDLAIVPMDRPVAEARDVTPFFDRAEANRCTSVLFERNHPDGDLVPAPGEFQLINRLILSAQFRKVEFLDYVIYGLQQDDEMAALSVRQKLQEKDAVFRDAMAGTAAKQLQL